MFMLCTVEIKAVNGRDRIWDKRPNIMLLAMPMSIEHGAYCEISLTARVALVEMKSTSKLNLIAQPETK